MIWQLFVLLGKLQAQFLHYATLEFTVSLQLHKKCQNTLEQKGMLKNIAAQTLVVLLFFANFKNVILNSTERSLKL